MIDAPFTIFVSAWQAHVNLSTNLTRMALLAQELSAHSYTWELCSGVYEGEVEQSIAVQAYSEQVAKRLARHVGYVFEQECVGLLDNAGKEFRLVYPSQSKPDELIGKFRQIPPTFVVSGGASFWRGMWWAAC